MTNPTSPAVPTFSEIRSKLKTIGASDSPAIMGVSPWGNPLSVYHQKTQGLIPKSNKAMEMGKVLEDTVAKMYEIDTKHKLTGDGEQIHVSPFWPWMHATPDRWRDDGLLVEIKTTGSADDWGAEQTDEIPVVYKVQCQHQMAVLNCERMDVAVLISGQDFRVYHLERDHDYITRMVLVLKAFYEDHILKEVPPAIDYEHPATAFALSRLIKFDPAILLTWQQGSHEDLMLASYLKAKRDQAEATQRMSDCKAKILGLMGNAGKAFGGDGRSCKRQVVNRKKYEVEASSYVRLDVHEKKEK